MKTLFFAAGLVTLATSASGQASPALDPFRIPENSVVSCTVMDKSELTSAGAGFRFELHDNAETRQGRAVEAAFDSAGWPLLIVIVDNAGMKSDSAPPQATILKAQPEQGISIMHLRPTGTSQAGGEPDKTSPAPSKASATGEEVSRAIAFATWLWLQRCVKE